MSKLRHKIGAVILTFMVLFSTMSFSMDMHFCGDHLVDFKIFQEADTCGMMAMDLDNSVSENESHCCSDVSLIIAGQDDLQCSFETLSFEQQNFLISFVCSYVLVLSDPKQEQDSFKDYSPPPLIRDVQILDQTFLI